MWRNRRIKYTECFIEKRIKDSAASNEGDGDGDGTSFLQWSYDANAFVDWLE